MKNDGYFPTVGLIWTQFSAYHIDRLEAVGRRFAGRAKVLSVEVTTKSTIYAWAPSEDVKGTEKTVLFPGRVRESVSVVRRFLAELKVLRRCDIVFMGVPYSVTDIIFLSFALRLLGKRVVVLTDSKFDDFQRDASREFFKRLLLAPYTAAVVGGRRQFEYVRFLGFAGRPVLPGANTVSMGRVRQQAMASEQSAAPTVFAERRFVFVGRFVDKKNIDGMLEGYALYVRAAAGHARRLLLVGDGPLKPAMEAQCAALGISEMVDYTGFLSADRVSTHLANALALVLVSREEQWGLVINEALAVGLPILASADVGAREALVRNLENGVVVEPGASSNIAVGFDYLDGPEERWRKMSDASHQRAWYADAERFADAVELLVFPGSEPAATDHARFTAGILIDPSRVPCV